MAKWLSDQGYVMSNTDSVSPMPGEVHLAYGLAPSGRAVPIRVDEDGYVLVKVSTVVGTHGSKQ
jgi:hypothetical protein